jgi:hypothetical protein
MQEYKVIIDKYGTECWYKNGKHHREDDKPAIVYADGTQFWYFDGKLHRESGPAVIYTDGHEELWYKNGVLKPNPKKVKELTVGDIEELLGHRVKIVR